jgi:hypothetical protein
MPHTPPTTTTTIPTQAQARDVLDPRSLKQLGFFFAGASFFALSTLITRRAVTRRHAATVPKFYSRSNQTAITSALEAGGQGGAAGAASSQATAAAAAEGMAAGAGPLMAVEALNLATLNVLSFAVMLTGGVSWAFDVSSLDDLRAYARRHIGPPGGRTEEEAEREVEEWMARVLARKGASGGGGAGE